jgi:SPP1 family predicted phage head-tail adaptor
MGKLNSGDLSERVTLLTPSTSEPDGRGGYLSAGPDAETSLWASVREISGKELLQYGQTLNNRGIEVTLRKDAKPTPTTGQWLTWNGESFNIHRVVADSRKEFTTLTCFNSGR